MKITYLSDLHFEFHADLGEAMIKELEHSITQSDLIVVAGDVGVLATCYHQIADLLDILSPKAKCVLYVLGNHEYWRNTYRHGRDLGLWYLNEGVKGNVRLVGEYDKFELNGYSICSGTLWFPDLHASAREKAGMSDFSQIKDLEHDIYLENTLFRKEMLKEGENTIFVSHHLPSYRNIHPKFVGSPLNQFFANDLDENIKTVKPILFVHGHTHSVVDYNIGRTRIVANPFGYPGENACNWEPKVIELPDINSP
jgi:predicted phosphohydrolase